MFGRTQSTYLNPEHINSTVLDNLQICTKRVCISNHPLSFTCVRGGIKLKGRGMKRKIMINAYLKSTFKGILIKLKPAFTMNSAMKQKHSQSHYNHLGRSTLLRWDILWIGFTFADSWWADKVTECTSSHLKHRHESRTGVSWVYQSCQSINDNYWARTPVGGERGNENDHGGTTQGTGRIMEIGK